MSRTSYLLYNNSHDWQCCLLFGTTKNRATVIIRKQMWISSTDKINISSTGNNDQPSDVFWSNLADVCLISQYDQTCCLHLNSSSWFFCHLSRCCIRAYFLNWKISQVTPNLTNLPNFLHCSKEPMSGLTASFGLFFNHLAVMVHKTCLAILVWCALWWDTIIFFLVHL